jgi:hypothetical protein
MIAILTNKAREKMNQEGNSDMESKTQISDKDLSFRSKNLSFWVEVDA